MAKKDYVPREVIENQLLVAMDDKSKVAIVASEADLDLLIYGLRLIPEAWPDVERMLTDLEQLKKSAFGG